MNEAEAAVDRQNSMSLQRDLVPVHDLHLGSDTFSERHNSSQVITTGGLVGLKGRRTREQDLLE